MENDIDNSSLCESVDIDYLRDMHEYETKVEKDTAKIEISPEEENMIIKKIKEDIINQVREDMGSELDLYKIPTNRTDLTNAEDELFPEILDPEIRKGLYQIQKLDKILLSKIKKEKQVKKERILLQKKLRDEIQQLEESNKSLSKEIKGNVMKFLALKPPVRHNEGLNEDTAEEMYPQFFQTEISIDKEVPNTSKETCNENSSTSDTIKKDGNSKFQNKSPKNKASPQKEAQKDFIKRNIELAGKASETVMLTDEEKERLNVLLADVDDADADNINDDGTESANSKLEAITDNPFRTVDHRSLMTDLRSWATPTSVVSAAGDSRRLNTVGSDGNEDDITSVAYQMQLESRLRLCVGEEQYRNSVMAISRAAADDDSMWDTVYSTAIHKTISENDDLIDTSDLGEEALKETKFSRESKEKLKNIDEKLLQMHNPENQEVNVDPDKLRQIIESAREIASRANLSVISELDDDEEICADNTQNEEYKSQSSNYCYTPKLTRELLDTLLLEARNEGIYPPNNFESIEYYNEPTRIDRSDTDISWKSDTNSSYFLNQDIPQSPSSQKPSSSRFPDIDIYRHMTSPNLPNE